VAFVNLPRMWQAFRSLAMTKHAHGRVWRIKEVGFKESVSVFWLG